MYEQQTQQSQTNPHAAANYWLPLHTYYSTTSSMSMKLLDSEAKVLIQITPALPGVSGKPQAGEKRYDYNAQSSFSLTLTEIQAIISAFRFAYFNGEQEQLTFFHQKQGSSVIFGIQMTDKGPNISIYEQATQKRTGYMFQSHKMSKDSQTFIPHEFDLFIALLESVISSRVLVASKLIPAAPVSTGAKKNYNNGGGYNNGNNYQQRVQQPAPQYNQMSQAPQQPQAAQYQPVQQQVYAAQPNTIPQATENFHNHPSEFDF